MSHDAELQKVKDLLDMGFIHDEEYERRIKEICGNDPIPSAFRIGGSTNTVDPFEEELRRRQEEEARLRLEIEFQQRVRMEEEERLRSEAQAQRRQEEMRRAMEEQKQMLKEVEAIRRLEEEERRLQQEERYGDLEMRRREEEDMLRELEQTRRELEEKQRMLREQEARAMREAEMAMRGAEARAMREAEEMAKREAQMFARANQPTTTPAPPTTSTNAKPTEEERRKAIEERQARDKKRREEEVAEEQQRQNERRAREEKELDKQRNYAYNNEISYQPQETPAFNPSATYSTPEYYAPTGTKLYPIYPPSYFATVHPFSFIAVNKNDPNDQSAINTKIAEIQRIIEQSKANPVTNWEEVRKEEQYKAQERMRQESMEALQKMIAATPKKPIPAKVDDGIDPNTLPQPTVHMIPPRKWNDSSEPYEAPKYVLPSNPNGVIVLHRSVGSVCQTKELDSPTKDTILKMFEMTDGTLTNVETGAEFTSSDIVPRGCYRLQSKIDTHFYRSMGTMPLLSSAYTHHNPGGRNSFNSQYERVPSAIADKKSTYYSDNVVFSYGNVRTTSLVHDHSYNESYRPRGVPSSGYLNYNTGGSTPSEPGWFKRYREENNKLDYVVCIRNVYRKVGKIPPLRLHRALKDSLDNNKCIICKQFAHEILCEAHKDERFTELMKSVGGNFAEIFGVSTEPTPMEEEVETPIYYKNHGEVVDHGSDSFKAPYIDFSDPNLQPKWALNGVLAERFNRIKENARMSYDMMMNDDYLVHKPGSEQSHLHD